MLSRRLGVLTGIMRFWQFSKNKKILLMILIIAQMRSLRIDKDQLIKRLQKVPRFEGNLSGFLEKKNNLH